MTEVTDLGRFVSLLRRALGLAGRVAQREDDRFLVELPHRCQDLLGEGLRLGSSACETDQCTVHCTYIQRRIKT